MIKSVLIIDDSKTIRGLLVDTLVAIGYHVVEALDGMEGLKKAKAGTFSLIITDHNMPNIDGIPLIRILRALPQYKETPILLLTTGMGGENLKEESKKAGATGILIKPFSPEKLKELVKKLIG